MSRPSGIGSWPGTSIRDAVRLVRDILADDGLPYLPELPARGPGADLVGRSAGLLVELPVDLQPSGWRFVDRPGHDLARTGSLWRQDLDELAEAFDGYAGELKVQLAGPWTLASSIWLHRGERAVVDAGACRDLVASLAEGLRLHLAELERLVPAAAVVVQLDEPSLPAVLAGRLPTASGYGRLRAVDPGVAAQSIGEVLAAAGDRHTVVHCCAPDIPLPLLRASGAAAISMDTTGFGPRMWESVAATVESGVALWAGALATDGSEADPGPSGNGRGNGKGGTAAVGVRGVVRSLSTGWRQVGLPDADLAAVTVTPACGLAGLSPERAAAVQRAAVDAARALTEIAGVESR